MSRIPKHCTATSTPSNATRISSIPPPRDAFDVVIRDKTALELKWPGIVSCFDILAVATRDLITTVGGPFYNICLGAGKFDNMYYLNLQKGLGLSASDQASASDPRTKPFVDLYAANEKAFFADFAHVMEKVSVYSVKTGKKGDMRHRSDVLTNSSKAK
ncbi:hypothetical protein ACH5RR_035740 [Cinchona calisaya]|uniref:peroxidase n=1 Tax=Cinchona calisaya TaxID=153742 RepID=A0ABD2Y153_9GENT